MPKALLAALEADRRGKPCFSPFLDRNRNALQRMLRRLKDFRRAATRDAETQSTSAPPPPSQP